MKSQCEDRIQLWVEALESGKYTQGRRALCRVKHEGRCHCVLGVALDVFMKHNPGVIREDEGPKCIYQHAGEIKIGTLPKVVAEWYGIDFGGELTRWFFNKRFLSTLNDTGWSLKALAGVIRRGYLARVNC